LIIYPTKYISKQKNARNKIKQNYEKREGGRNISMFILPFPPLLEIHVHSFYRTRKLSRKKLKFFYLFTRISN
jgi:hypothetical protein